MMLSQDRRGVRPTRFARVLAALTFGRQLAGVVMATSRTTLVAFSVAVVAIMVASVLTGPAGDLVLARDRVDGGDRAGSNFLARLFGLETAGDRVAEQPAVTPQAIPQPTRRRHFVAGAGADQAGVHWRAPSRKVPSRTRVIAVSERDPAPAPVAGHNAVCVRLCDGFFFPMGTIKDQSEVESRTSLCAGLCPSSPTRLFVTPGGSDDMSRATAVTNGQPYDTLPVAFAHTREVGPTCGCHPVEASSISALADFTLRSGDSVMTPIGWRVFQGADHWPYRRGDFTAIRSARNLPAKVRTTLADLEEASLGRRAPPLLVTPRLHVAASGDRRVGQERIGTP